MQIEAEKLREVCFVGGKKSKREIYGAALKRSTSAFSNVSLVKMSLNVIIAHVVCSLTAS